jgi:ferritin
MTPNKLNSKAVELLTPRIEDEYKAMYFYRAAANWATDNGYFDAAEYFDKESKEEAEHAEGIQKYLVDWNVLPVLPSIETPETFKDLVDIINKSYAMEYELYEAYEDISLRLMELPDISTFDFIQKYRANQTQSVAKYADKLNMLEGVEGTKFNLLVIEKKLFA